VNREGQVPARRRVTDRHSKGGTAAAHRASDLRNRLVACALICLFVIELFPKTAEIRPGVR
jgi:hypothetical protein